MAITNGRQVALCVMVIVLCGTFSECRGEVRCDAICNYDSLREQCERCRLRVPMRFGKRSSPPEEGLLESPDFLRHLKAADDFSSQFLQYLSRSLQQRSTVENGKRGSRQEEDVGEAKRRAAVLLNDWSANSVEMIRKKRTLEAPGNSDGWLRRVHHLLKKPKDVPSVMFQ